MARRYPDRVINVGIREPLLISVAGGLALTGMRPIAHTYAPFLVERPFEQLKLDLVHQGVGAVLVSVGASYDAASSGRTHHAPEDVALLDTLPDWTIHVPGHPDEVDALLRAAVASNGPVYLRLDETSNPVAQATGPHLVVVRRGTGPTIVAVGPMLSPVLDATKDLDVSVLYAATIRPFDGDTLRAIAETPEVILVEPTLAGTSVRALTDALTIARRGSCAWAWVAGSCAATASPGSTRAPMVSMPRGSAPRSTRSWRPETPGQTVPRGAAQRVGWPVTLAMIS